MELDVCCWGDNSDDGDGDVKFGLWDVGIGGGALGELGLDERWRLGNFGDDGGNWGGEGLDDLRFFCCG